MNKLFVTTALVVFLVSCSGYRNANSKYNKAFESAKPDVALGLLQKKLPKNLDNNKSRLLYYYNLGITCHLAGKYEESNAWFEKGILFLETEKKSIGSEIFTSLTNANLSPYFGEGYEEMYAFYYKGLNYLYLNNMDDALVECRRMNDLQKLLADKYKSSNKLNDDAFIYLFIGIVYETVKDYNNAFIAYRNAYETYQNTYVNLFGFGAPLQVKKDLLRIAQKAQMDTELEEYEKLFNMKAEPINANEGQLVYFWHQGMAPQKTQWSLDFLPIRRGNQLFFVNLQTGIEVPIKESDADKKGVNDITLLRIALPKFHERTPKYAYAELSSGAIKVEPELVENVSKLAVENLANKMAVETGKAVVRMLLKKAAENAARAENEGVGAAVSVLNYVTEQADTRNWATLPHSIFYSRLTLPEGNHEIKFQAYGSSSVETKTEEVFVKSGKTVFKTFRTYDQLYQ